MIDKAHRATDAELDEMVKKLNGIYSRAASEIKETWHDYLMGIDMDIQDLSNQYYDAKKNGADQEILRQLGMQLTQAKREKIMMNEHYEKLLQTTTETLANTNEAALAYLNGEMPKIYALNYNAANEGIANTVRGYSYELVDADTVRKLITEDVVLLPEKHIDALADHKWNRQKINGEVLQGIIQGESIPDIARRLTTVTSMNQKAAIRNARTMTTSAENAGRMDSYHRAQESGIIIHKVWMATSDERTRDWHREMDGQEREIDEPFEVFLEDGDVERLMYPGDPEGSPANVYNCRCTLVTKILGFKKVR